jgi:hypothetical protein
MRIESYLPAVAVEVAAPLVRKFGGDWFGPDIAIEFWGPLLAATG